MSRRSELLNCVGKYTNKRMDVGLLRVLKNGLPESILQGLTKDSWEARVSMSGSGEKVDEGYLSVDKMNSSVRLGSKARGSLDFRNWLSRMRIA